MLKVWRCKICGDGYLGKEKPTECPFCGADGKYIVLGKDYDTPDTVTLSDISKENLEKALKLELGAVALYKCAKKKAENNNDLDVFAFFKAVTKVELEHAVRICKFLGVPMPDEESIKCSDGNEGNLKETERREDVAVKEYKKAAAEAVEPVIKMFFLALVEVEQSHLDLAKKLMEKKEE